MLFRCLYLVLVIPWMLCQCLPLILLSPELLPVYGAAAGWVSYGYIGAKDPPIVQIAKGLSFKL